MGGRERRVQGFGGKPEGKRQLGRPRRRWEDNIKMDLQEVGCGDMDWIQLAQDRDRWRALVLQYLPVHHHHHHLVPEGLGMLSCSLILKMKLVPPSLPRSSYVSSSFWFIL